MQLVLGPSFGLPRDESLLKEAQDTLAKSLQHLETVWLKGRNLFLADGLQPSIADLSLACELKQLEVCIPSAEHFLFNIGSVAITHVKGYM